MLVVMLNWWLFLPSAATRPPLRARGVAKDPVMAAMTGSKMGAGAPWARRRREERQSAENI